MLKMMDLLTEGMYDKGIFKAVFMAGGPGSGKSFVAKSLYGIPDNIHISIKGMKMVNQDKEFKYLLKKYGFNTAFLDKYPEGSYDEPVGLRDFAKDLSKQRMQGYMNGKLGMVIDSTGSKFAKVQKQKKELEKQGYDCYMVFVMTSLEVALQRNTARAEKGERELPKNIVVNSWKEARKNLGGLKALFGSNFKKVDNDKHLNPKQAKHAFSSLVKGYANKWANEPIKNPIGKQWVKDKLRLQ